MVKEKFDLTGKVTPATNSVRVLTGGLFTRVKWNGTDLGVRAWAPQGCSKLSKQKQRRR